MDLKKQLAEYLKSKNFLLERIKLKDNEVLRNTDILIKEVHLSESINFIDYCVANGELVAETFNTALEYDSQCNYVPFTIEFTYNNENNEISNVKELK